MSSLKVLNLRMNSLSGMLPENMCDCIPKLTKLFLSWNLLSGKIPSNIYKCRYLEELSLYYNHFNGSIPREIGSLTMLRWLSLGINDWEGGIPLEIGELPDELGKLNLEFITVHNNSLFGTIPISMFNISTMKAMELSYNQFSGHLASTIGLSLPNLEELYLSGNKLSGVIPSSITNASKLTIIEMSNNFLTGTMPNFGDLRLLRILSLAGNNLTGKSSSLELIFFSSLTNCRYLEISPLLFKYSEHLDVKLRVLFQLRLET